MVFSAHEQSVMARTDSPATDAPTVDHTHHVPPRARVAARKLDADDVEYTRREHEDKLRLILPGSYQVTRISDAVGCDPSDVFIAGMDDQRLFVNIWTNSLR